ncbi:DUF2834 domain-containing protein [Mycolicibacterium sp. CR10]|uniref:DUF2834 domain-containing protein n=1 Tax=Mycolicibacterium sp. CR10 TaxID=2562314 RepID=UPI0010C02627|nr:DUF2834 domain-containing protein [Mycolicibacterium sp. CR10]
MTESTGSTATSPPVTSKVLCGCYAAIALVALVATWSQNAAYLGEPGTFLTAFVHDLTLTPAARSITADILLFFLAAAILMVVEARRLGIRFVWLYIIGGALIAISVTFPLFLIARELRIAGASENPGRGVTARPLP